MLQKSTAFTTIFRVKKSANFTTILRVKKCHFHYDMQKKKNYLNRSSRSQVMRLPTNSISFLLYRMFLKVVQKF
jgi:hypothetical protein